MNIKQRELFSYVYDFVSGLVENKEIFENTRKIILFGSVVRGDFHEGSDVDVFLDVSSKENKINDLVKKEINKFEDRIKKTWGVRGVDIPVKVVVGDLGVERWKDLKDEILEYGIVLYDNFRESPGSLTHKVLISYEIKMLSQKKKMAFLRRLYGYKIKKCKKEYIQKGLIDEIKGEKFDSNSVIVSSEEVIKIKRLLKEYRVNFKIRSVWVK